ncbi:MAG: dihydroneopterin aldolase [Arenicella sp.]|jgi:dihydroneopterin aldolase
MGLVKLEGMEFFAYHGFYDEEQTIGNKYNVDLSIHVDLEKPAESDKLSETINYEILYRVVRSEMEKPSRLLEHIAARICNSIFDEFESVEEISINISKFNPPLGGICRCATIVYEQNRANRH